MGEEKSVKKESRAMIQGQYLYVYLFHAARRHPGLILSDQTRYTLLFRTCIGIPQTRYLGLARDYIIFAT
jgi:hypothetical protein